MDQTTLAITLPVAGAAVGATVTWVAVRGRIAAAAARAAGESARALEALSTQLRHETEARATAEALLGAEREQRVQEREYVAQLQAQMEEKFTALSSKALKNSSDQFLALAKTSLEKHQQGAQADLDQRKVAIEQLVKPLADSLKHVEQQVGEIEKTRISSHAKLLQQVQSLETTATTLATALSAPKARGRWGEMQLRRVVEMAGMVDHCDFVEQANATTETGRLMPDMVINLAGGKSIVVDSKVPFDAYVQAMATTDTAARESLLADHAARVRQHITELSRKEYARQFEPSPDFVVLFLPGEDLFSAALTADATLVDFGMARNVVIASPVSLITLLRSVAIGWREEALAENAHRISELGSKLYERAALLAGKWSMVGKNLERAVKSYNESVASMEKRFLVTAREFPKLGVKAEKELEAATPVEQQPQDFVAPELVEVIEAPALTIATGSGMVG